MKMLWITVAYSIPVIVGSPFHVHANVLYSETFEDGSADGIVVDYGSLSVGAGLNGSTGAYVPDNRGHHFFTLSGIRSDDVSIQAEFRLDDAGVSDFEVYFAADDPAVSSADWRGLRPNNGYFARVNPLSSDDPLGKITRLDGGNGTNLIVVPNTISAGETHTLRVDRVGARIDVFLDGRPFASAIDGTYTAGEIEFLIFGGGAIDDILVTAIPEPAMMPAVFTLAIVGLMQRHG